MTEQQALAHAQKRWGNGATVAHTTVPTPLAIVGYRVGSTCVAVGKGPDFVSAFADADAFILRAAKHRRRQQSTTTGGEQ